MAVVTHDLCSEELSCAAEPKTKIFRTREKCEPLGMVLYKNKGGERLSLESKRSGQTDLY